MRMAVLLVTKYCYKSTPDVIHYESGSTQTMSSYLEEMRTLFLENYINLVGSMPGKESPRGIALQRNPTEREISQLSSL